MILPTSFAANWYAINSHKQAQSQSATDAKNCKCIPHEFHLNNKVLNCHNIGNPYLGKLAKPTQGPFKANYQHTTTPNQWYHSHTAITNFC
jgi:hypothetical protein